MSLFDLNLARTQKQVALYFGKTTRTIQRWVRAGMPRTARGYDLADCEKWLKAQAYSGSCFRETEHQVLVDRLFELAVEDLRRGLLHLCSAYVRVRGKSRQRLIDRAIKGVLHGTLEQLSLLEGKGGGGQVQQKEKSR